MFYSVNNSRNYIKPCLYVSFFFFLSLFFLLPGTPVLSGTIDLPQTGQTSCYNTAGAPISCNGTGQDGDFLAGVAWPESRFTITRSLDCIIDNLTGLMWSLNAYTPAATWTIWNDAVSYPPGLYLCGYADWRLPNINELQSLFNAQRVDNTLWLEEQGFRFRTDINPMYWSSTSSSDNPFVNAWNISMVDGSVVAESKQTTYLIWPVRGTSSPSTNIPPGQIAETGQIASVSNYDDAYFATSSTLNVGVPWPTPRFTVTYCDTTGKCPDPDEECDAESSNNIVTDNLSGLVWSADANLNGLKTWSNALSYANGLASCGYGDWRLPNSKELFSLIDRSQSNPALPAVYPFENVQSGVGDIYWSSTSYAINPDKAWIIDMLLGNLTSLLKTETAFVWPVRGGQTKPYVLTVRKEGTGRGNVTADGLTCLGKTCKGEYASYDEVIITATAQTGSVFTEWTDCPTPSGNICTITLTNDITIEATFLPEYKIAASPRSLNFKNLKQNVPSTTPLTVTVTNAGVSPLQILSIDIIGDDASVFSATPSPECPGELTNLNDSCTISVIATSDTYDNRQAQLQISSNDPKKPATIVRLKARAKPPKIAKKPASLNFGKVTVGVPIDKILTITNKGITELEIPFTGVISKTGDNPDDFSFSPATCPPLATGATCTLTVTFNPAAEGKRSAILQIPSNDPKRSTLSVKLGGVGQ